MNWKKIKTSEKDKALAEETHLTPRWRELISHTCQWGGGFQRHRKSFKIGQKQLYSQVNEKE